jgi:hypothetical protein
MKTVLTILAVIMIVFGVLFIMATFSASGQLGWLIVGIVLLGGGLGLVWFATRKPKAETPVNVTYKVDLSGDVNLESLKCKSCGGTLTAENVKMVAGAPVVNCPYCGTSYQLTEEPKW